MFELLTLLKKELIVVFIGALPLLELRGAVPIGVGLGFTPLHSTILSIIGNIIPIPFLLLLLRPIMDYLGKTKIFGNFIDWIRKRTLRKSEKVVKYSVLGLFLLVAIPLPTTGAYTGCVAATLLNIRFKYAFPTIVLGVIAAGIIMFTLMSVGLWTLT